MRSFPISLTFCAVAIVAWTTNLPSGWGQQTPTAAKGYQLRLISEHPDIVTPVGLEIDVRGRVYVVESHTHKRPDEYAGPSSDRIRMLTDSDDDGVPDTTTTVAEGFQQAMNLLLDREGHLYVVTRRDVTRLRLREDGIAEQEPPVTILRLETSEHYPHNGLSGIAWNTDGSLFVGLGENFGAAYRLVGSDGVFDEDSGGVGKIYVCSKAGENLRRFAIGFWNPFSICVLPSGRVFAVDNDPDASPPCRLLDIVETGDYGHRWEYGRAGVHPLQAWDGDLPGTLPMVAGTGESPTAVVPFQGALWVTSWGDHRIERYQLVPEGGSYRATRQIVVQGDADFRPTGMAAAPDGTLYFADWVDRSYPVHGKGRIWRLELPDDPQENGTVSRFPAAHPAFSNAEEREELQDRYPQDPHLGQLAAADAFTHQEGVLHWSRALPQRQPSREDMQDPTFRLGILQAQRWQEATPNDDRFRQLLQDPNPDVRLFAVRWIAEKRRLALIPELEGLLEGTLPTQRYYLAVLAAIDWLGGDFKPRATSFADGLLGRELVNPARPPELRTLALQMIAPDHPRVTLDKLGEYLQSGHAPLRLAAVRTLALRQGPERWPHLAQVAGDSKQDDEVRAEAIAGLAGSAEHSPLLVELAKGEASVLAREAARVLRLTGQRSAPPTENPLATDLDAWAQLVAEPGDPRSGRRLFFSTAGPRCGVCHQFEGRGGHIGPDLTRIAQSNSPAQIITSIIQPSREIAPRYQPWILELEDGQSKVGLRLPQGGDDGQEHYADADGRRFTLASPEIEFRQASTISIMPEGLEQTLTAQDLRDLVTFLRGR